MYKHILVPTDSSTLSTKAVDNGLRFAREIGAKVTILTVIEPFRVLSTDSRQIAETRAGYERHVREEAARHLADAGRKAGEQGVACETLEVEHEHPYQAIIETAAKQGCDLIAMASHGRRGVSALVIGSETAKVLTHSTIPVLVYR